MALGIFHNYLYFNPLSSLMGNSEQPIVVRLWVQKTKRKALKLNEFLVPFSHFCWNIAGAFFLMNEPDYRGRLNMTTASGDRAHSSFLSFCNVYLCAKAGW